MPKKLQNHIYSANTVCKNSFLNQLKIHIWYAEKRYFHHGFSATIYQIKAPASLYSDCIHFKVKSKLAVLVEENFERKNYKSLNVQIHQFMVWQLVQCHVENMYTVIEKTKKLLRNFQTIFCCKFFIKFQYLWIFEIY